MSGADNLLDPSIPASLGEPAAYPNDASAAGGVTEVQTHLSHVFLTRDRVYKVKKSLDVGFVSFLTREARNHNCLRELHLNRRLAPDVYLGVAPIEPGGEGFRVGATRADPGELGDAEHCVVMRRLPADRDASALLARGELSPERLDRVAERLAAFHADQRLGRPSPFAPDAWLDRIWSPVAANFRSLTASVASLPEAVVAAPLTPPGLATLEQHAAKAFDALRPSLERRRVEGRAVDAHGDLHLEHIWFETADSEPLIIDCLEFDDALRQIDAASEVAFLAMDLGFRGRSDLAERWLAHYAAAADDYDLYSVVDFFMSYRAAVRGKVEAIAALDSCIPEAQRKRAADAARERVRFSTSALANRAPGPVYLVGGIIGAGKSTAARVIADALRGVQISTDVVRQHDVAPRSQRAAGEREVGKWKTGLYTEDARERIYDEVLKRAEAVVRSGRAAILDASWSSAEMRERARRWAAGLDARSCFVEVVCSREETLARLEKRRQRGQDPSEAGPEIYDAFVASYEAIRDDEWPLASRWTVHTDEASWRDRLFAHAREQVGSSLPASSQESNDV